jgi:hypothetical protein
VLAVLVLALAAQVHPGVIAAVGALLVAIGASGCGVEERVAYTHWREGDHDDLVLATAMAVWFREWSMALWERSYLNKQRRQAEEEEEESAQPKGSLLYPPSRSKKPTSPEEEARQLAASRIGSRSPSVRRYGAL